MDAQQTPRLGLRERKRLKLRRAVQTEAFRLFAQQGFERTTVEQIADAAEVSTTTFYRYFPAKEDVVVGDDYDAVLTAAFASRSSDEPLVETLRAAFAELGLSAEADKDYNLVRLQLVASNPALASSYAGEERRSADFLTALVAERVDRNADDFEVQVITSALVAATFAASRLWATDPVKAALGDLIDEAIYTMEPVIRLLESPRSSVPRRRRKSSSRG